MNVKSVEKENGKAKVVVEIDKAEFEQALNKAYAKCRKDIMLPGFRKGKAPRKMVESMYGATVFYEDAVNEIFPDIYTKAIVEQELKAVGSPSVSNMDTPDEGGVVLTIETELYPEVTLGQYKGLEVPKREVKVEESEVDAEVNRMAERNARIETVDRAAANGDTVVIDFEGFVDDQHTKDGGGQHPAQIPHHLRRLLILGREHHKGQKAGEHGGGGAHCNGQAHLDCGHAPTSSPLFSASVPSAFSVGLRRASSRIRMHPMEGSKKLLEPKTTRHANGAARPIRAL